MKENSVSYKKIMLLALPIIFANITLPLQGIIDVAIIGHLDSSVYLSAIGLAGQWFTLLFASFNFLQYASSGLSSQLQGQGDKEELKYVLFRSLLIASVIGLFLIIFQWLFLYAGLAFFTPAKKIQELFTEYYAVRIWGAPFELANYAFIGWFSGQGKPTAVFRQQLTISLNNIFFSLLFVLIFNWGVTGIALGTLLANFLGFLYALSIAKKSIQEKSRHTLSIRLQRLLRRIEIIKLMRLNRDIFIRTSILTLSFAWITRLSAQQGELILATNIVLLQLIYLSAFAIDGIAVTTESLVGQAYGQKNKLLVNHVIYRTTLLSLIVAAVISIIFIIIQPIFLWAVTSINEVNETAKTFYLFAALAPLMSVIAYQFDGVMFGLTANKEIRNAMITVAALFFPVSFLLPVLWHNTGVWLTLYWLFILRGSVFYWYFKQIKI